MTFNKMILISAIIGEATTALKNAAKAGRFTAENEKIAESRVSAFEAFLNEKEEEYFTADSVSCNSAFEVFRVAASKDFLATI